MADREGPGLTLVGAVLDRLRSDGCEPEAAGRDRWVVRSARLPLDPVPLLPDTEFRRDRIGVVRLEIEQDVPPWR